MCFLRACVRNYREISINTTSINKMWTISNTVNVLCVSCVLCFYVESRSLAHFLPTNRNLMSPLNMCVVFTLPVSVHNRASIAKCRNKRSARWGAFDLWHLATNVRLRERVLCVCCVSVSVFIMLCVPYALKNIDDKKLGAASPCVRVCAPYV